MIIGKSIKLASGFLGVSVILLLTFNWLSEYIDFTSNQDLRDVRFGVYALLLITPLKFVFDFYLIYIKRAHVEITDAGILDKTPLQSDNLYAWSEIVNIEVQSGIICQGLKIIYKNNVISGDSHFITNETVTIKELTISDSEKARLERLVKKYSN